MLGMRMAVQVATPGQRDAALDLAVRLAQRLQAQLDGVHAVMLPTASFAVPEAVSLQVQESEAARVAAQAQQPWWEQVLQQAGLRGDWRVGEGDAAEVMGLAAAASDLLVLQRPRLREDVPIGYGNTSRTVFGAQRPVLVLPAAGAADCGRRVLLAWNGSIEAVRALHGALPLLAQAEAVHVLDGSEARGPEGLAWLPTLAPSRVLELNGIAASSERFAPQGAPAAAILARAQALQCDLIVMGAWGHSRLAEMILGGVTRALFRECPLPLLVAH